MIFPSVWAEPALVSWDLHTATRRLFRDRKSFAGKIYVSLQSEVGPNMMSGELESQPVNH